MNNRNTGLKILFGPSYSQWVYDPERLSYITPYFLSLQTSKYAYQIYSQLLSHDDNPPESTLLLWDMFGGIGTDSIYLSRYFNVIVTEIDRNIHDLAVNNVRTFNKTNINLVNDNCINMINKIQPHVIYFDPPWGNSYKNRIKNFDFNEVYIDYPVSDNPSLSSTDLPSLNKKVSCVDLLKYIHSNVTPYIIVKSPINSNTFERSFPNQVQYIHKCPNKNLKFIYLTKVRQRDTLKIYV
jgi:16S rRNA G966 N2-methylase RsmD